MLGDKSNRVIVDLSENLSASELELLRKSAEAMEQSLGVHIAWLLLRSNERQDLPKNQKKVE